MRFSDPEYIERYVTYGEFPKIHDDIFAISSHLKNENVLDLGCCTGLLSVRLATRNNFVVGIEANKSYFEQCVKHNRVEYVNLSVSKATLGNFADILDKYTIHTIYARIVLPELYDTGGIELVEDLACLCYEHNIKRFVIEGRKSVHNAVNALSNISSEINAMSKFYTVEKTYKECRILIRK